MRKSQSDGSVGARFLWALKRITPETALGVEPGAGMADEMTELYDRACLFAARRAMRIWRSHLVKDPLDREYLSRELLTYAVADRDRFCLRARIK